MMHFHPTEPIQRMFRMAAMGRGCVKTPALRLRVENLSRFRQSENKSTDDRYGGKTTEKTMLRVLRARMFLHSLGQISPFVSAASSGGRAPKPDLYAAAGERASFELRR